MNATCSNCNTSFHNVDRNEDGSPAIEATRCEHPGCEVYLCRAGCDHISAACTFCGVRVCEEHYINWDGSATCLTCMADMADEEGPCECVRTDVDAYDNRGCPSCDPRSDHNIRVERLNALMEQHAQQRHLEVA